jgi:hypothetical protein
MEFNAETLQQRQACPWRQVGHPQNVVVPVQIADS